jgi:hypothetical protein
MYVKCIDAHGTQLEEGRVYEATHWAGDPYRYALKGIEGAWYGAARFVEATNVEKLIEFNRRKNEKLRSKNLQNRSVRKEFEK